MSGSMPNLPGEEVGYHAVPLNIVSRPASFTALSEFHMRKIAIAARMTMAIHPQA